MSNKRTVARLKTMLVPSTHLGDQEIIREAIAALEKTDATQRERDNYKLAFDIWIEKTDWVQTDKRFDVLLPWGKHRADILREYIERLEQGDGKLSPAQAVIMTGYTGIMFGKFSDFHADAEKRLGRPIWAHEFSGLREELKEAYRADFMALQPEGATLEHTVVAKNG